MFQAVFTWATPAMDGIDAGFAALIELTNAHLPKGLLTSFIADGLIAGVGSVLVFLPQILILFFFILLLEDSGYMARAAFLMDRIMAAPDYMAGPSSRCCPATPAPFPASWRPGSSTRSTTA